MGLYMQFIPYIPISLVFILLGLHFVAEYVSQPPQSITFKGNSPRNLVVHSICHAIPFGVLGAHFMILICLIHFIIEMSFNSLISRYWTGDSYKRHRLVIGISQTLHIAGVFFVYYLIGINYVLIEGVQEIFQ